MSPHGIRYIYKAISPPYVVSLPITLKLILQIQCTSDLDETCHLELNTLKFAPLSQQWKHNMTFVTHCTEWLIQLQKLFYLVGGNQLNLCCCFFSLLKAAAQIGLICCIFPPQNRDGALCSLVQTPLAHKGQYRETGHKLCHRVMHWKVNSALRVKK